MKIWYLTVGLCIAAFFAGEKTATYIHQCPPTAYISKTPCGGGLQTGFATDLYLCQP